MKELEGEINKLCNELVNLQKESKPVSDMGGD